MPPENKNPTLFIYGAQQIKEKGILMIGYWTQVDCEQCGCQFYYTRTEKKLPPKDNRYICSNCKEIEKQMNIADERVEDMRSECIESIYDISHRYQQTKELSAFMFDVINKIKNLNI